MPKDQCFVDVPIPEWDYEGLQGPSLTLVLPYRHPTAQALTIEKAVRLVVLFDEDYDDLQDGSLALAQAHILRAEYFEIEYLRDCSLRDVIAGEWEDHPTFGNVQDYLAEEPTVHTDAGVEKVTLDTKVRIVALREVRPNLKELNRRYGNEART